MVFMFRHGGFRSVLRSVCVRWVWMRLVLLQTLCSFFKFHPRHARTLTYILDNWRWSARRRESCLAGALPASPRDHCALKRGRYELVLFWHGSVLWSALFVSRAVSIRPDASEFIFVYLTLWRTEYYNRKCPGWNNGVQNWVPSLSLEQKCRSSVVKAANTTIKPIYIYFSSLFNCLTHNFNVLVHSHHYFCPQQAEKP